MTELQVPQDLFNGVLDYLKTRPWQEVAGAMPRLLAIQQAAFDEAVDRRDMPSGARADEAK